MGRALPAQPAERAFARMLARIEEARTDVNAFCELIGEGPGGVRLRQDVVHERWQRFWDEHKRSVLLAPVGHGKTTQLRHRLLHKIGRNPNIQIAYISATERHPKKVLRSIKSEIERNRRVRWVFPHLKRGPIWTTTEIEVPRDTRDPDPTFQIFGAFSQSVLGTRADVVVFDDLCNFDNTLTEYARDKMDEWIGEVLSRLKPTAEVIAIGHIWDENDQLQRLMRKPNWGYLREEATHDDEHGEKIPLAPRVMSLADIQEKANDLGPVQSEMMLYNRLPSKSIGRFKKPMFERCLARGRGLNFLPSLSGVPTYSGVDLGHREEPGKDRTAIFTAAVLPEGTRQVVDIRSGNWSAPDILRQIKQVQLQFGSIVAVENNGAQQFLLDFAADLECLPVRPHNTGRVNKHDLAHGVESLALELDQGKWMLPADDNGVAVDEMAAAIKDCMVYNPKRHCGDRLMAWWICREAIRLSPAAQPGLELPSTHDLMSR